MRFASRMYVATVPNRSSPPAVLLRESYRDADKVKSRTLANLTHWPADKVDALRRVLKGETPLSTAAVQIEACAPATAPPHPLADPRQAHLVEIAARAQGVQAHPVADLAGDAQHRGTDRSNHDRHRRQPGRLRREIRGHQAEPVVVAAVVQLFTGCPAMPDRPQRADVIAQPGRRRAPGNPEAALVVALDLAAEAQHESAVGVGLQVPGLARHHRRAAREGDGNRRRQLDPLGRERSKGKRRKNVMPELDGLAATRLISAEQPDVKVVILTASEEDAHLFEAIKSGAQGYLFKNLPSGELFRLLDGVARGEPALTPGLAKKLLGEFARPAPVTRGSAEPGPDALTEREYDGLELLVHYVSRMLEECGREFRRRRRDAADRSRTLYACQRRVRCRGLRRLAWTPFQRHWAAQAYDSGDPNGYTAAHNTHASHMQCRRRHHISLSDISYDIVTALQNKLDAVTVYDQYIADCQQAGNAQCEQLFEQMKQQDEQQVEQLRSALEQMVQQGQFH